MRVRLGVVLLALLAGCAQATPPSASPAVPVFSTAPVATGERAFPATCDDVATLEDLTRLLNNLVTGDVHPIVGVPQENIGRTARLDCYYGVPAGQPVATAKVWVGLAAYVNEESARKRMTNTVNDERAAGSTVSDVPVGADRGVLVRNATWMLVAARGRTTVVVQVLPVLVRDDQAGAVIGRLAAFALTER
jgi:hypothetical protein